jgi:hypothetical protein
MNSSKKRVRTANLASSEAFFNFADTSFSGLVSRANMIENGSSM